jgi:hypothetical protein
MKKLLLALCSVSFLLLSGCAATRLTDEAEKQIKNVAIISLVPEKANYEKIGLTVFNNERGEIDMGDQINSTIESVATKRLAVARPAWKVATVSYDRAALIKRLNGSSMVMAYNEERIEKELAEIIHANRLDALIVVSAYKPENSHGDGVGVLLRTLNVSSIQNAYAHSNVSLKIMDTNGKIVARSPGQPTSKRIDPVAYGIGYSLSGNFSPELITRLRADITENLAQTVNQKLEQLGM